MTSRARLRKSALAQEGAEQVEVGERGTTW